MAVVTNYHNEGATDLTLVASWRTRTFGAGAVPILSGINYFAGGTDNILGTVADGTGLDSPQQYVSITSGFAGRIGSGSASPVYISITKGGGQYSTNALDYAAGGGVAYIAPGTNNGAGAGIGQVNVKGAGKLFLTGGTINTGVAISMGELDISNTLVLNSKTIDVRGGSTVLDWKSGDLPNVNIYGGTLLCRRGIGTLNAYGGRIVVQVEKAQTGVATLNLLGDAAEVDLRCGDVSTTLNLQKGRFTLANAVAPIDLSAATTTIADVDLRGATSPGAKVTWNSTRTLQGLALDPLRVAADTA